MQSVVNQAVHRSANEFTVNDAFVALPVTVINRLIPGNIACIYERRLSRSIGTLIVFPPFVFRPAAKGTTRLVAVVLGHSDIHQTLYIVEAFIGDNITLCLSFFYSTSSTSGRYPAG